MTKTLTTKMGRKNHPRRVSGDVMDERNNVVETDPVGNIKKLPG